ncbi:hypothetical protein LWI28_004164 [Acer negundo]|uniref:Uncharacterized protein n=1 Tax=Acer negundo TaxID=4023 RepID=A0AAD5NX03_ACENE|nr:hypothetical protein LWI28_004164 [Acer negundo]
MPKYGPTTGMATEKHTFKVIIPNSIGAANDSQHPITGHRTLPEQNHESDPSPSLSLDIQARKAKEENKISLKHATNQVALGVAPPPNERSLTNTYEPNEDDALRMDDSGVRVPIEIPRVTPCSVRRKANRNVSVGRKGRERGVYGVAPSGEGIRQPHSGITDSPFGPESASIAADALVKPSSRNLISLTDMMTVAHGWAYIGDGDYCQKKNRPFPERLRYVFNNIAFVRLFHLF